MSLQTGDEVTARGQTGTIVATTATLDSNGRGTISYGGDTYHVTVLKHPATSRYAINPLSTNGADAYLRVGLAEVAATDTSPALYGLVFEDPYWAPQRHWQTPSGDWDEPAVFGSQDSTVIRAGWMPGYITVSEGGTPQVGVYVGFRMTYETSHGECKAWWQPAYPFEGITSTDRGCFITDASGYVEWRDPDNTRRPVILPRLLGARGHREGDAWDGAPPAERVLSLVECVYLQEAVEVTEGADAELDVNAVQVDITGPPSAKVTLLWEGSIRRAVVTLDGSGLYSATGLPPGSYVGCCYHPSAVNQYVPFVTFEAPDSGGTYTCTFATSWSSSPASTWCGVVYAGTQDDENDEIELVPCEGAVACRRVVTGEWEVMDTTDADGAWSFTGGAGTERVIISHGTYGTVAFDPTKGSSMWVAAILTGRFGAIVSDSEIADPEGMKPWGPDGDHVNHQPPGEFGYLKCDQTGYVYPVGPVLEGGVISTPAPRWLWSGSGATSAESILTYKLYDTDGTLIASSLSIGGGSTPPWTNNSYWQELTTIGKRLQGTLGGKINGYALRHSPAVVTSAMPEPYRYGAEFGENLEPLEVRIYSETTEDRWVTWTAWECAYCHAPVWLDPSDGTYTRFACMECGLDMRAYWSSPTLAAVEDHIVTVGRLYGSGGTAWVEVIGHPRPEEYDETAGYQVANYLGSGYTRWVAVHIELGELEGGTFTDGESIADVETRLGRTVGPVMLKAELQADYGGGKVTFEVDATHPGAGAVTLAFTVPGGASEGDLFPLKWGPHHDYPAGYYTDITDVRLVAGSGTPHLLFVNDGPAWHSSVGVQVESGEYSPWGCDLDFGGSEPHLRIDAAGRVWLAYRDEGAIWVRYRAHLSQDWSDKQLVVRGAQYSWPCVIHWPDGSVRVAVMDGALDRTVIWQSKDDGRTWEGLG